MVNNILIIGITGNGKSALASLLASNDEFKASGVGTSKTKHFQVSKEPFEYEGKKYRLIDNIGFGDTGNISEEDIFLEIGEGVHSAKEGINQILFVFKGRFGPEQVEAFKKFKAFISESGITKYTTLVRTRFDDFRNSQKCEDDRQSLLSEDNKDLREIIDSCNGRLKKKKKHSYISKKKEVGINGEELNKLKVKIMAEIKTILLIGRSGRGKSTLANVLLNKSNNFEEVFKESSGSISETKKIQFEQFAENDTNYLIIDTPGIGDTKMSDNEVLDIIAEAIYRVKDGLSQVLFIVDGRFDQYEMATYNLLRTIIFDENVTSHTTLVRTNFADFRSKDRREKDIKSMKEATRGKKIELEKKISDNEKQIKTLSPSSEECQKMLAEAERLKKELKSTLSEIIESCEGRVIHVDNSPSDKKLRKNSRKKILDHLQKTCQEDYNPEKLKSLRVEKEELPTEKEEKFAVIEVKAVIAQLQDKKEKLQKEIAEKEKKIRQKVLKHIFNNYQEIKQEIGGNIFLDSVTDARQLTVEGIKRASYPQNVGRLRKEYLQELRKETEILSRHNLQLSPKGKNEYYPKDGVSKDDRYADNQNYHEDGYSAYNLGKRREEVDQALDIRSRGLEGELKLEGFVNLQALWCRNNQLTKLDLSDYLSNLTQLTTLEIRDNVDIDLTGDLISLQSHDNYPKESRSKITKLDIKSKNLTGELKLVGFSNLVVFDCFNNQLTNLDLSDCSNLTELYCFNNRLTSLNFLSQLNPEKLTKLDIRNNNFPTSDLTVFSHLVNLEVLLIASNKLEQTNQGITNKYLPDSLETFFCSAEYRPTALGQQLVKELEAYGQPKEYYENNNYAYLLSINSKVIKLLVPTSLLLTPVLTPFLYPSLGTKEEKCKEKEGFQQLDKYKRVVIIGIDGIGRFSKNANVPTLDKLASSGASSFYYNMQNDFLFSLLGSMLFGVFPERHGFTNAFLESGLRNSGDNDYPSIFKVLKKNYPNVKMASFASWDVRHHFLKSSIYDHTLVPKLIDYIADPKNNDVKLLFVHLTDTDEQHSKNTSKETESFLIICGKGIVPGSRIEGKIQRKGELLYNMDVAAITLKALGVEIPSNFDAELPFGVFNQEKKNIEEVVQQLEVKIEVPPKERLFTGIKISSLLVSFIPFNNLLLTKGFSYGSRTNQNEKVRERIENICAKEFAQNLERIYLVKELCQREYQPETTKDFRELKIEDPQLFFDNLFEYIDELGNAKDILIIADRETYRFIKQNETGKFLESYVGNLLEADLENDIKIIMVSQKGLLIPYYIDPIKDNNYHKPEESYHYLNISYEIDLMDNNPILIFKKGAAGKNSK
ncbi:39496_t:CDS:10 [Gigaspora margarita]|uniref:39496_t:CDS:1 n=1 Tax=Gigaspora margarita TaxID=4874 RepID=A0ABM8VWD1_GIGMA|nr:39496_t:CDS:10 [Gigaspora margarita]